MCHIKDILQKLQEPLHKCEITSFKMYDVRYVLKYIADKNVLCQCVRNM